jgi:hypothetical protein
MPRFLLAVLVLMHVSELCSMTNLWNWIKDRTVPKAKKHLVILIPYHGDRFLFEKSMTEEFRAETKTVYVKKKIAVERGGYIEETYEEQELDGYDDVDEVTEFWDTSTGQYEKATKTSEVPRYKTVTKTRQVPTIELEEGEEEVPEEIEVGKTLVGKETTVRFFSKESAEDNAESVQTALQALVKEVSSDLNAMKAKKLSYATVEYKRLMVFDVSDKLNIFTLDVGSNEKLDDLLSLDKAHRIILTGNQILTGDLPTTLVPPKEKTSLGIYFSNLIPTPEIAGLLSGGKEVPKPGENLNVDLLNHMMMLNKNLQSLLAHIQAFTKPAR